MTRGRRLLAAGMVGALVVGGGAVAWAANASSAAASYRTAPVTRATVHQTLTGTGSVEPRSQATLAFGAAGTVGSVAVDVGDRVRAGQVLARLRTAGLRAAVTDAQATLAAAKATLASDQESQASAASDSASADSSAQTPSTGTPSSGSTTEATQRVLRRLARGQARVVAAQRSADRAIAVSTAALAQQQAACVAVAAPESVAPCASALGAVDATQHRTAAAQVRLEKAITALTGELEQALGAATGGSGGDQPAPSSPAPTGSTEGPTAARAVPAAFLRASAQTTTPVGQGNPTGSSSGAATAATLARDQAAIDSARAALIRARDDLRHAALASPIAGSVTSVGVAPGDSVSAGDTAQVVVAGDGGDVDVTIEVAEGEIRSVRTGQRATVVADGATDLLSGRVTATGLMSASTDGTAAYPVTVTVPGAPASLASGSNAAVTLVVATARDAVSVPSSALTTAGTGAVVRVLVDGKVTATRVEVGAVGDVRTEVTSGLRPGQRVVLADLSQPLPTGSSDGAGSFRTFTSNGGGPPVTFSGDGPPPGR